MFALLDLFASFVLVNKDGGSHGYFKRDRIDLLPMSVSDRLVAWPLFLFIPHKRQKYWLASGAGLAILLFPSPLISHRRLPFILPIHSLQFRQIENASSFPAFATPLVFTAAADRPGECFSPSGSWRKGHSALQGLLFGAHKWC